MRLGNAAFLVLALLLSLVEGTHGGVPMRAVASESSFGAGALASSAPAMLLGPTLLSPPLGPH
jgi:hypothetical protein